MKEKKQKDAAKQAQGKASRERGKRGERMLSKQFVAAGYTEARRSVQYNGRARGAEADVVGVPGLSIESKFVERLNIVGAYRQSCENAKGTDDIPIVCHKRDREPWLVTLSLDDFIRIYKCYQPPTGGESDGK